MKSAEIPSLKVKGDGKALGVTDGSKNYGLHGGVSANGYALGAKTEEYNVNVGTTSGTSSTSLSSKSPFGITTDSGKSGIITDTGSLSTVSFICIIKY